MIQEDIVYKFNGILNEFPLSINRSIIDKYPEASPLYFIVKEVFDFINLRTKSNMLIVKLRSLMILKTQLKKKIESVKSKFNSCLQ